jgi:hypothetical protein
VERKPTGDVTNPDRDRLYNRGACRLSGRKHMVGKMGLAFGVALVILAATPAFADCASAMKSNDAMMMKSTDMAKKDSAMKEQNMAKEMMGKKDEAGCMMHANKAMEMIK